MKISHKIKLLSLFLLFIAASIPATTAHSANLFIDPASPLVQVGGEITLNVTNASGEVMWSAFKGKIEGTGNTVKYKAPDYVTIDLVSALDNEGNDGKVKVVVQEKAKIDEQFSKENANWEVFTSRDDINALLLSDDEKYLWVGTTGGLEKRNAATGQLIQVFTNLDGLPDNYVPSLLLDDSGGLWVGTWDGGLAHLKSDGSWQVFNTENSELPGNWVNCLLSDGGGGLWIGTSGGLTHRNADDSWQLFNKENSGLPSNSVDDLLSDGNGGLWIGTSGGLTHRNADGSWQLFNKENSELPSDYVHSLLSDGGGGLWIGTSTGLANLKPDGSWQIFNTQNSGLPDNFVSDLLSDGNGGLWIGHLWGGGLANLKSDGSWQIVNTQTSESPSDYVHSLLSDGSGGLWIGTSLRGLAHLKSDNTWEVFNTENSVLDNDVRYLLSDGSGGLWIGSLLGLSHLKLDGSWEIVDTQSSEFLQNPFECLLSDGSGGLWTGTFGGGLAHLKADGSWKIFHQRDSGLPNNYVQALLLDGSKGLWIGTYKGGLANLKSDGKWLVFNTKNSELPSDYVNSLLSDAGGGLWIGTSGGLTHRNADGSWQLFNKENSELPNNYVYSLLSDGGGGLWIGTNGGLAHYNAESTWQVFNTDNSKLPDNYVHSLLSDASGGLWIGTNGGLALLKSDNSWQVFNTTNSGLPYNGIDALQSDGSGGLWIGTRGLAHLTFSSGQIQDEQYLKNNRAAIIIAGGGNTDDNALWDSTAKISNYAYKMLNKRGFVNNDIHYISPQPFADFNGDGIDDKIVDSPNPARQIQVADIQAAFDWAETKGTLNQPLYIFFTDHGGNEQLQLAQGVYIKASELKTMLDDYQKTTSNKVVFVIDACHSGTMVKALAGENRAVISSTDDGVAYFDRLNGQSFIWYVTKGLNKGMNFSEAFYYASSEYKKSLGKVSQYESISAGSDTLNLSQEPQFDDTGDGLYTISVDGDWLKKVSVNGTWSNADITLMVEPITQSGVVSASGDAAFLGAVPLKAKATLANGRVNRVWAVIRPPKMDILVDNTGIPLLAFPKIDLSALKADKSNGEDTETEEQNIYQGSWNGFVYNGEYEITFYAEDNQGNIEGGESIKLTVTDGMVCPEKGSLKVGIDKQPDTTGKIVYKSGDTLKMSATENLVYGYDLYVALLMPDGNFVALKNPLTDLNQLQKENFNKLYWGERWIETNRNINMGKTVDVVDLTLSDDVLNQGKLPQGSYCVYAALIPERQDLMVSAGKGLIVLDGVCFEIK